jgi:hypothetical protein
MEIKLKNGQAVLFWWAVIIIFLFPMVLLTIGTILIYISSIFHGNAASNILPLFSLLFSPFLLVCWLLLKKIPSKILLSDDKIEFKYFIPFFNAVYNLNAVNFNWKVMDYGKKTIKGMFIKVPGYPLKFGVFYPTYDANNWDILQSKIEKIIKVQNGSKNGK